MNIDKTSNSSIVQSLEEIATDLLLNKVICINNSKYSIIDLEVYYYHPNHKDEYANGIEHNRNVGELEVHRYGIDLSLGNEENDFGGILIRGLYDIKQGKVIKKSEVVKTLFNNLIIGNNKIELIVEKTPCTKVLKSQRLNLGDHKSDPNKQQFSDLLYKYMSADPQIFHDYPDKESILRKSNLNNSEIKSLIGYNLKK